jgi:ribonuclease HI
MDLIPTLEIYTDGASSGNPGPGGFGVVMKFGKHRKEMSGGYRLTTNNRMELLAVIVALESLKNPDTVGKLYSDSKYVVDSINKGWLQGWVRKRFAKVKNPDLWIRLYDILKTHKIEFVWVKGHASNVENNRCDQLAVAVSKARNLPPDEWYEANQNQAEI